jgi:hypothetical protein
MNKGVLAAGLIVGIVLVALVIRVKFYFDPPTDNFTSRYQEILSEQITAPDFLDPADTSNTNTVTTVTVTPTVQSTAGYQAADTIDLGTGIPIATTQQSEQVIVVVLEGSELIARQYDANWVSVATHTLATDVDLVNGQPPLGAIAVSTDGYQFVYSQLVDDEVTMQILKLDSDFAVQSTTTIRAESTVLALSDSYLWLYNSAGQLQTYSLTDQSLLMQQALAPAPCTFIIDQTDAVAAAVDVDTLVLTKLKATVGVETIVSAAVPDLQSCIGAARDQQQLALLAKQAGQTTLQIFNDTVTEMDPSLTVPNAMLYPQVGWQDTNLWLLYSTSEVLGDYQLHVANFAPAVVAPLDVTAEYTN